MENHHRHRPRQSAVTAPCGVGRCHIQAAAIVRPKDDILRPTFKALVVVDMPEIINFQDRKSRYSCRSGDPKSRIGDALKTFGKGVEDHW